MVRAILTRSADRQRGRGEGGGGANHGEENASAEHAGSDEALRCLMVAFIINLLKKKTPAGKYEFPMG